MGNKSSNKVQIEGIEPIGNLNNFLKSDKPEISKLQSPKKKKKSKTPEKAQPHPLSKITEVNTEQEGQTLGLEIENKKKILPSVKLPRKMMIKKTKEAKQNAWEDEQIEQIPVDKKYVQQPLTVRQKTTPLMHFSTDSALSEFSKTKKCRVSKML